jgi:hypothetical protein
MPFFRYHSRSLRNVFRAISKSQLLEMRFNVRPRKRIWRGKVVVWHVADISYQRSVVQAKIMHHARYATNVVVTAAYEAYEGLPSILPQYPDACKLRGALLEVRI